MLNNIGKYHYYDIQGPGIKEDANSVIANFTMTQSSMEITSPTVKISDPQPVPVNPPMHNPQEELDAEELELATDVLTCLNSGFTQDPSGEYSWKGDKVHPFKLEKLCQCVQRLLYKEHVLIDLSSENAPVCIFGDIHGEYRDLRRFTNLMAIEQATQSGMKFLFLGDYVDRGPHPVEVVAYLFALKVIHPNSIFMLSGNHEHSNYLSMRDPGGTYRLYKDIIKLFGKAKGKDVYSAMVAAFGVLPWAATIDGEIFCSHGGFPRYNSREELAATLDRMRTQSPLVDPYYEALSMVPFHDVMYSDPILESAVEVSGADGGGDGNQVLTPPTPPSSSPPSSPPSLSINPVVKVQPAVSPLSPKKSASKKTRRNSLKTKEKRNSKAMINVNLFPKGFCKNMHRKGRDDFPCCFNKDVFDEFCQVAKVDYLIRAHQHFDGYTGLRFEKRLFTIFTSTELFEVDNKRNGQAIIYFGKSFHVIVLDADQALLKI